MDSLESFCSVDEFLSFSSDVEEDQTPRGKEQENECHHPCHTENNPFSSYRTSTLPISTEGDGGDSFPVSKVLEEEEEEEELEWLKEGGFPPLEPCVVACVQSPRRLSPVSVLESGVPGGLGFQVPACARSRSRSRRRRRVLAVWGGGDEWSCTGASAEGAAGARRRCRHCLQEKTPQWRAGPHGPKTLCNACGVRYKAGRLVPEYRPARSPTFSSARHSNSHKKILEMRRTKKTMLENG